MVLTTERPAPAEGVAKALHELARGMEALEREARERRENDLANAYRNREDAYDHAASIAGALTDAYRARVVDAIVRRYERIRDDQAAGVSGGSDLARKQLLVELMDELDIREPYASERTPW